MTHFKQLCQTMNLNLHVSQSGDAVLNALNLYFSKNPEGNFKMVYFNFSRQSQKSRFKNFES